MLQRQNKIPWSTKRSVEGSPNAGQNRKRGSEVESSAPCGGTELIKRETMQAQENNNGKEKVFHSVSDNGLDLNNHDASDGDTYFIADPEFFDFDQLQDKSKFRPNQIWAVYDDEGCMPRYYAWITKVTTTPNFMVHYVWLDFTPKNKMEAAWYSMDLPVACGRFKLGDSGTSKEAAMFSQTISFDKSDTSNFYEIYPRKGEVWALFKGWNVSWSENAENHREYQYDVVQVLADLSMGNNIIVVPLVKIKGFVSLFIRSKEAAPFVISQSEMLMFSHCIPHHMLSGTEREGVTEGSLELDPAGFPNKFEEYFPSIPPECLLPKSQERDARYAGPSTVEGAPKEETSQHKTTTAGFMDVDEDNIWKSEHVNAEAEFHMFSERKLLEKFSVEQIWALYSDVDKFPNYYGLINEIDLKNGKIQVRWLNARPQGEEEKRLLQGGRPIACGAFKLSGISDVVTYSNTEAFSHPVEAMTTGRKCEYEIIPNVGEIWAVYKNWRKGWTAQDYEKCEYKLVEIFGYTDSSTQVKILRKVDGYNVVFMACKGEGSLKAIRKDEYLKFSHQIPCFHLTDENGGKLRGCLELDPFSLPDEFLIGSFSVESPCKGSMSARERQGTTCLSAVDASKTLKEETSEHKKSTAGFMDADDDNICKSEYVNAEAEFHVFSERKLLEKFSLGQIWALYSDVVKFPNYYGLINEIDVKNGKIQVRWLNARPQGEEEKGLLQEGRPIACGAFKMSSIDDVMTYSNTETFSHPVKARKSGKKGEYEIIPNLGEIWAIYRNWRKGWTAQDYEKCGYELVEIVGYTDSSRQVKLLSKMDGYNVVFVPYNGERSVKTIRKDEYLKFSHQIPCFRLTHENRGKLRGCVELDPFSMPEEFLVTSSK